ncbi:Molybdopterin-binding protein [Pseudomonas syringae pv. maculicola]|uniref:Molybdopterin-binding protein n=1 Tax=Pseudomonas syringae pv. maculicola TaxID=59511 RepID=A0A0N1JIR1_PSEYM|nr:MULTISPECIES: sulfite dehydrogenase [Pseudomonas]KPC13290.1 Molybdopterin-binding protein [Pseudomonas syringae pv. maculicola]RMM74732.1 Molybdopterin-binding protein [Pseudomonas syringae pv. maculicola]RMV41041.1 Molybdopterin-binding protein [Pseudomonas syringae pv. maculicola]SIR90795.1 sulfane dehydrogenase subunit SoxC [Pseudomonas sp. A214]
MTKKSMVPAQQDTSQTALARRDFLIKSGAVIGTAAYALGNSDLVTAETTNIAPIDPSQPLEVPQWTRSLGAPTASPYGKPSTFETKAVRNLYPGLKDTMSAYSTSPLQELDGIITPNGLFYERHHAGVPQIDPAQHRLVIHGLTENALIFTVDEIRQFPAVSRVHFMECSGNPSFLPPWGKTAAEVSGLVSCAEWTGVTLKTLLDEAGLKPQAKWIIAEGADGAAMTRSIPIEKCLDDVMVVYSQNGERLRPEQGYPLRLFVPGYEGNTHIKWLRRLHVTDSPAYSREETAKYTDLMADGKARKFSFVMECKSLVTYPSGTQKLTRKGLHEMRGIAWSGHGKITRVDVSVDGGNNWTQAKLQEPILTKALTVFRAPFEWNGQELMIMSRAIDETGYVQPMLEQLIDERGKVSFYHNNSVQPWRVSSNGEVTNGRA